MESRARIMYVRTEKILLEVMEGEMCFWRNWTAAAVVVVGCMLVIVVVGYMLMIVCECMFSDVEVLCVLDFWLLVCRL